MSRVATRALAALFTMLVAGLVAVLWPGSASAHTSLESSDPAAGAELTAPPAVITLTFNEEIRDFAPQVAITVGSQPPVTVTPTVNGTTVTADLTDVDVPADPDSILWTVGYRVVSADGHPVAGVLEFSVAAAAPTTAESTPPSSSAPEASPEATSAAPSTTAEAATSAATEPTSESAPAETTSAAAPTSAAPDSDDPAHDTASMVWWFVGGGVLIVGIAVAAVVATRRAGGKTGGGRD